MDKGQEYPGLRLESRQNREFLRSTRDLYRTGFFPIPTPLFNPKQDHRPRNDHLWRGNPVQERVIPVGVRPSDLVSGPLSTWGFRSRFSFFRGWGSGNRVLSRNWHLVDTRLVERGFSTSLSSRGSPVLLRGYKLFTYRLLFTLSCQPFHPLFILSFKGIFDSFSKSFVTNYLLTFSRVT